MKVNLQNSYDSEFDNDDMVKKAKSVLSTPRSNASNRIKGISSASIRPSQLGLLNADELSEDIDRDFNVFTEDVRKIRADQQGNAIQAFNAVVGGVASGLATAVEDISYLADFDNHIKAINGGDTWEKNWLAEEMGKIKESINEAMPIYRPNNETFDWDDSGFYWSSLKGVIDSAVGFGLPGGAIAKGVGLLGKGLGTGAKAIRLNGLVNFIQNDARIANSLQSVGAGFIQNYAEGKIMGIEAYENVEKELLDLRGQGKLNISDEDIKKYAGEAADNMLLYNRSMILSDAFALSGLMKGIGSSRYRKVGAPGFNNRMKDFGKSIIAPNSDNLILQGLKEAGEEIGQNVMQMEAQYGSKKKAGVDISDYEESFVKRAFDFATSDQALLEGMMGFFGGGPQRILSEITSGRGSSKERADQYNKYEQTIAEAAEFVEGTSSKYNEAFKRRDSHNKAGNGDLAKAEERRVMADVIINNANNGTLERLEADVEALANGEATEQQKQMWGENYRETAREMLEEIKVLEKEWLKYSNRANVNQIVNAFSDYNYYKSVEDSTNNKLSEVSERLNDTIDRVIAPKTKYTKKGKDEKATPFVYDIENLETNPYDKTSQADAYNQYEKFKEKLEKYSDYQDYKTLNTILNNDVEVNGKVIPSIRNRKEQASIEYEKTKERKAEEKFIKKNKDAQKRAEEAAKRAAEEAELKKDSPELQSTYKDNKGKQYKVVSLDASGTIEIMPLVGSDRNMVLTREQFDKKFSDGSGKYTKVANKKEVKNAKNEASTKEAKENIKTKPEEEKSKEEKKVEKIPNDSAAPTVFEPLNLEENNKDEIQELNSEDNYNGTKNPLALAWLSANNLDEVKNGKIGDVDITEYLEDKNNSIVGQEVSITIGLPISVDMESDYYKEMEALLQRFENADNLSEKETEELINDLVNNGSIKVTFVDSENNPIKHDGTNIELFLHTPNFKSISKDKVAKESTIDLRKRIITSLLQGKEVRSKVIKKHNGSIQNGEFINVDELFIDSNIKDIQLLVRDKSGNYMVGVDKDGHIVNEKKLRKYRKEGLPAGAIFAMDTTSNGEAFPVRLHTDKLTYEEAELVYMIYKNIIGIRGYNSKSILTAEVNAEILNYVKNSDNPRVKMLIGLLPNGEQSTVLDLLNEVVYEGKSATVGQDTQMYTEKGKVNFGNYQGNPIYFAAKDMEQYKDRFIRWMTENKLRNVDFKRVNNPKYKEFLISQGVLKTNAVPGLQGALFAQPTIVIGEPTGIKKSTIKPAASSTIENKNSVKEKLKVLDEKKLIVDPNDSDYYINENDPTERFLRVSNLKGEYTGPKTDAADRGTIIDDLLRKFINGEISSLTELKNSYSNHELKDGVRTFTPKFLKDLHSIFTEIKKVTDEQGIELISTVPTLWGTINNENFAGTIDLLGVDKKGNVYIIDLKTSSRNRRDQNDEYYEVFKEGDSIQQSAYAELLKQRTGINVKNIVIFPIQISTKEDKYILAKPNKSALGNFTMRVEVDKSIFPDSNIVSTEEEIGKDEEVQTKATADEALNEIFGFGKQQSDVAEPSTINEQSTIAKRRLEELEALPFDEDTLKVLEAIKKKDKARYDRELRNKAAKLGAIGTNILERHDAEDALESSDDIATRIAAKLKIEQNKPFNNASISDVNATINKIKKGEILLGEQESIKKLYNAELAASESPIAQQTSEVKENFEKAKINTEIKIGKEELNAYIAELKAGGEFSKEDIDDNATTLFDSFALYTSPELGFAPREALEQAKQDLLDTLKNC